MNGLGGHVSRNDESLDLVLRGRYAVEGRPMTHLAPCRMEQPQVLAYGQLSLTGLLQGFDDSEQKLRFNRLSHQGLNHSSTLLTNQWPLIHLA